jgi:hypothetical protein
VRRKVSCGFGLVGQKFLYLQFSEGQAGSSSALRRMIDLSSF